MMIDEHACRRTQEKARSSINRYKEVEYEAVEHDSPQEIPERLAKLEEKVVEGRKELAGMLG